MRQVSARHRRHSPLAIYSSLLALLALILSACGTEPAPTAATTPPTPVTIKLAFSHNIEFGGMYIAHDKGYYTAENLSVTLDPRGEKEAKIISVENVLAGKAQFGIAGAEVLLAERAKGNPLVAIATIYQRSAHALISMADNNIVKPADLKGKKIMTGKGGPLIALKALLKDNGLSIDDVTIVDATGLTDEELTAGRVDVRTAFINNQPITLEKAGHKLNQILFSDYGIDIYANVIFTTEEMIAKSPDVVSRFLNATLKGYQDMIANPADAAQRTVTWNPQRKLEFETESAMRGLPLLNPAGSQFGMMKPEHWEKTHTLLVDQGELKAPLDVKAAYTMQFLNTYYSTAAK